MFPEERRQKLISALEEHYSMSVSGLAERLGVSEATIRRDLNELQKLGVIRRTHGGALLASPRKFEPTYTDKKDRFLVQKQKIGRVAAGLVEDGETVILDAGTTTLQMVRHLKEKKNITVITNALSIIEEMEANEELDLVVIGGRLRFSTRALVGPMAEENLRNFHADKVFIAANGCTIKEGLTTPNLTEAYTKRAMVKAGSKVIAVLDHSKFGEVSLTTIAPLTEIDVIVTDDGIDKKLQKEMEQMGIEVIIAE
ncbi:MAG TPA: DeoR/GlpR transcriptional regulator [Firmicutes bacterium]|uniref:DeoR/GlpR transcriptional regulator n=1 Tax=Capillibacterium thermochitinicola TaxID=2699427 RepID=A0A8J6HYH1_9FIRM|nr:DeoR/GlpR family DNA-binding transcription regulator [Capillibacterium thermochitinicola]MBA2133887.1 DeoR/GlpR transcriptional regulator [Capillibacterium thermochitinicola]HHW13185.1 DeoR/GlpR transcriptional regulator [Bacillota bacterium]